MTDWQPIETAPKDGTLVWLFPHETTGVWDFGAEGWLIWNIPLEPDYTIAKDWSAKPVMWFEVMATALGREPTHWMPRPEPPTQ